jgi:hypothetical protein
VADIKEAIAHYWGDPLTVDGNFPKGLVDYVWEERERQLEKRGIQERASGSSKARWGFSLRAARKEYDDALECGKLTWVNILNEEVLEAFEETDPATLRAELVQVMAVAASWILDLDRRGTTDAPEENFAQDALDVIEVDAG